MDAATTERPGSTAFRCTPKLLSFRSFALLLRSIKPDRENATNVHDDATSSRFSDPLFLHRPSSFSFPLAHATFLTFLFTRSLFNLLVFRLSVTVLLARAPYTGFRRQLTAVRPSPVILVAFWLCRRSNVAATWFRECQLNFFLDYHFPTKITVAIG